MKIEIREAYGEWALDIEMPDRIQVIYFTSKQNALQVMHYLQLVDNIIKLDEKKLQTPMTNYDRIKAMNIDEMAEFLCDNFECDICPAFDGNYCPNSNLKICSKAMKKHLESEAI